MVVMMVDRTVEQIAKEKHLVCLCLWPLQPLICVVPFKVANVVLPAWCTISCRKVSTPVRCLGRACPCEDRPPGLLAGVPCLSDPAYPAGRCDQRVWEAALRAPA